MVTSYEDDLNPKVSIPMDIIKLGEELEGYEYDKLRALGADLCIYEYAYGDYEGIGSLLYRVEGKWYYHNMGHCSCYGPVENLELDQGYESLDLLKEKMSGELYGYAKSVFATAKDMGLV